MYKVLWDLQVGWVSGVVGAAAGGGGAGALGLNSPLSCCSKKKIENISSCKLYVYVQKM